MAAATASTVALGGLSSAADAESAWDQLAECESNQQWGIDTGNGYYGGLQFAKGSWDAAGGEQYANYPHQASRSEQIAVAESLLQQQGASAAWPACTAALGLTTDDLLGSSDGGDSESDEASTSSEGEASADVEATAEETYTVQAGDTLVRIAARLDVDGGWKALYEANAEAIDEPGVILVGQELVLPDGARGNADQGASSSNPGTYRVRTGDTLSAIAKAEAVGGGWSALHAANRDIVPDPNLIRTGQVLDLP